MLFRIGNYIPHIPYPYHVGRSYSFMLCVCVHLLFSGLWYNVRQSKDVTG